MQENAEYQETRTHTTLDPVEDLREILEPVTWEVHW